MFVLCTRLIMHLCQAALLNILFIDPPKSISDSYMHDMCEYVSWAMKITFYLYISEDSRHKSVTPSTKV